MKHAVRPFRPDDFPQVIALCHKVYPNAPAWSEKQFESHLKVFPEGQRVAVNEEGKVVGYSASLVVYWDDYDPQSDWKDFTEGGYFTNHDLEKGRTLYGAEIMVDPECRGQGVGKLLYIEREQLTKSLGLLRIRAGARLRDYHQHAATLTPAQYAERVCRGQLIDRTLTFQLRRGFQVLSVVGGYLKTDKESLGYAAVIEWLNPEKATPEDWARQKRSPFYRPS